MIKRIIIRSMRQPVSGIAVILFAAVLTVVLCHLHSAHKDEMHSFEESYASVPVFFKVTDLDGSRVSDAGGIEGWIEDLFADSSLRPNLSQYILERHIRVSYDDKANWIYEVYDEKRDMMRDHYEPVKVTGITSTYVAEELTAAWGGAINWNDGYDESILKSKEFVCILPESLREETELVLQFIYEYSIDLQPYRYETTQTFQVVGYYDDPGNSNIYIPYPTMEWIYAKVKRNKEIEVIGAILNDNTKILQLREDAAYWFAEPNPSGTPTPWGRYDFDYYFYALDIDDTMLRNLQTEMHNSIRMNQIAAAIVFTLSAGAGFLTGFLVIRSRKREITLMRTMGASQSAIYLELAMEQLICIAAGILVGGGYALWQPLGKLCIFGIIYFAGLTAALLIFLHKNLLTTIKEDE